MVMKYVRKSEIKMLFGFIAPGVILDIYATDYYIQYAICCTNDIVK